MRASSKATQRYIRRSLDVGLGRRDAVERWSRDPAEAAGIRAQERIYSRLDHMRLHVPDDSGLDAMEPLMAPLITMTAFDLGQDRLPYFRVLPLPLRAPDRRQRAAVAARRLLRRRRLAAPPPRSPPRPCCSRSARAAATAPGWSNREPVFFPEWVEKVDTKAAA